VLFRDVWVAIWKKAEAVDGLDELAKRASRFMLSCLMAQKQGSRFPYK
jgi:hypothetical protein